MTWTYVGNVGIGTGEPEGKLDVAGVTKTDYLLVDPQNTTIEGGEIQLSGAGGNPPWLLDVYQDRFRIHSEGEEKVTITRSGKVGIGTPPEEGYRLYVNGPAYATGGWQGSSIRLKTDIQRLNAQEEQALLAKLTQVPLYRYRLKDPDGLKSTHLGVLAEESPSELVDDRHKAISYSDYLAALLAAVKTQQTQLHAQQEKLEAYHGEVKALKAELARRIK